MTEHKYAYAMRWIADGKRVDGKSIDASEWVNVKEWGAYKFQLAFQDGEDGYEFRLAPRTVKVGDVELEAPRSECQEGEEVFVLRSDGSVISVDFYKTENCVALLEAGRIFHTRQAAEAAHAEWVKLMRGAE